MKLGSPFEHDISGPTTPHVTLDDQNLETDNGPPAIQSQYADLYDSALTSLLTVPVTDEWVDTRDSETHVLTAGDPTALPIVVFQGGNVMTPVTLAWVQELADDFYLIAPDTPGEPGKSPSETPHEYGPWVVDVLNGFGIDQSPMVGVSHGAGVLLEGPGYASDRIVAAALIVPADFGTPFSVDLARIIVSHTALPIPAAPRAAHACARSDVHAVCLRYRWGYHRDDRDGAPDGRSGGRIPRS